MLLRFSIVALALTLSTTCTSEAPSVAPTPAPIRTTPPPTPSPSPVSNDPFALATRYDSHSPAELAATLVGTEQAIRSGGDDIGDRPRVQQAAYRQLVRMPEWRAEVFRRLPGELRGIAEANVRAGAELRALTAPRTELPPWRIVPPPPAKELKRYYDAAQKEFGIDWTYLAAIHLVETRMGRIRGTSIAGARGPMQFLPSTWSRWGEGDIESAHDSILAAGRYLRGNGAPGDMDRALFAYNHSNRYVQAIKDYAQVMRDHEPAYLGYYGWEVYYRTTTGDALLYVGWPDK